MNDARRGPIAMWLRAVCCALGLVLTAAGVYAALGGHRLDIVRGSVAVFFGLLFLIPAFKAGPNTDLQRILARYRRARRLTLGRSDLEFLHGPL